MTVNQIIQELEEILSKINNVDSGLQETNGHIQKISLKIQSMGDNRDESERQKFSQSSIFLTQACNELVNAIENNGCVAREIQEYICLLRS